MQKIPVGPVHAITFDMYGTLLDLVAGFGAGLEEFLEGRTYSGGADDVIQAWEATYLHESNADSLLGIPVDRAISAGGAGYYKAPHRYLLSTSML